jgi:MoaA/NifB/PqqE/SkfB family radical SAM enzyme
MIAYDEIRIVHVEASSRCNSQCPMCSRYTGHGFVQPDLIEGDLTADIFYKLFTKEFAGQLDHVYFSGVYGDPCLNKLLPEFVNFLIDNGCKSVSIDTNGGYRSEDWWASMAHPNVLINFALDGTDNDALEKYRIGVKYDKVFANLTAYVAAGGQAQWNFIAFKHNEHQIETAKQLAKDLGVKFRLKVTQKFRGKKDFKVLVDGNHVFTLEPPDNEQFRHNNVGTVEHIPITLFKFNLANYNKLNQNKISCKSQERQEIYLTASGLLMPCCYLGTYTHDSPGSFQFKTQYDTRDFDLNTYTVLELLEKLKEISSKWDKTIQQGNLLTCLYTCGNQENRTLYVNDKLNKENILKQ